VHSVSYLNVEVTDTRILPGVESPQANQGGASRGKHRVLPAASTRRARLL